MQPKRVRERARQRRDGAARVIEGVLEAGVLVVLDDQDGYGYELASSLTERNLMPVAVAPARVYDALRRLEEDGAVAGRDEGSPLGPDRRRYRITPQGRDRLARWADALLLTERSLRRLLDTYHTQRTHRSRRKDAYSIHDLGAHRGAGYESGEPGAP